MLSNVDDKDLKEILLAENIISSECKYKNQNENSSEVINIELTNESNVLVETVPQEKYENEDDLIEVDIAKHSSALDHNRRIMALFLELKERVTSALQKCDRKLMAVEKNLEEPVVGKTKVLCSAGMPYFKDKNFFYPAKNEDEILKDSRKELQLRNLPKVSSWTKADRDILLKAVKKELAARRLLASNGRMKSIEGSSNSVSVVRKMEEENLNWYKISSLHFEHVHCALDCCAIWNVLLRPDINKSRWTKKEKETLNEIVERCRFQDWNKIAKELNTNRSAYQCFVKHGSFKKAHKNCSWEEEEDKRLENLIEIFGIGDFIPWAEVSSWMHSRNKQQTYFRWMYSLAPHLTKGRFSKTEDEMLRKGVTKYGRNFRKISAALMPTRTTGQLHDRYQILLTQEDKQWSLWTLEEDTKLLDLFQRFGAQWSAIAQQFPCKDRTKVRHRYTALQKYLGRGVSLAELHTAENKDDNAVETAEGADEDQTSDEYKNVEQELIEFFCKEHKTEKPVYEWGETYSNAEKLKYDTINLFNILQVLNAELFIPVETDHVELNERNKQLLKSLVEHVKAKSDEEQCSKIIEEYRLRMFGKEKIGEEASSYFVPPPLFFSKERSRSKVKNSRDIDYSLKTDDRFLVEPPTEFNSSDLVKSYIGEEQESVFEKLGNSFEMKSYENGNLTRKVALQGESRCKKLAFGKRQENFSSTFVNRKLKTEATEGSGGSNISYATHATLFSFKNIKYFTRLEKMSSSQTPVQLDESNETFNLLETRLEQLFKYPICMSNIEPQKFDETDVSSSCCRARRDSYAVSSGTEKRKRKKLQTSIKNTL